MEKCEQCGNASKHCFIMEQGGQRHLFDSFECAIFAMAPACSHCGCRILGHGIEVDDNGPASNGNPEEREIYCCRHCLEEHRKAMASAA